MPTFNQGIRTNAGYDLFGKVQSGQTAIHYTKVVYSSLDLSNKSDDDIQNMTDVNPKELIIPNLQVLYKPKTDTSDQETEIRAIGSNEILKKGFYIKTYALYAADDSGHEILYGVTADNNPSWLPAYDGVRPQALTYNWDTGDKDTNNVHFTDSHDAYATYGDYEDFTQHIDAELSNKTDINSTLLEHNTVTGGDLNNITDKGIYPIYDDGKSIKNNPIHQQFWGSLIVLPGSYMTIQMLHGAINGIPTNQLYFLRDFHGDPQHWSDWYRIANSDDVASLQSQITSNKNNISSSLKVTNNKYTGDLNDLTQIGVYPCGSRIKNSPDEYDNGLCVVLPQPWSTPVQLWFDFHHNNSYWRVQNGNWFRLANSKDINDLQNQINNNNKHTNDVITQVHNTLGNTLMTQDTVTGGDLNNITDKGIYPIYDDGKSIKNNPIHQQFWGSLIVLPGSYMTIQMLHGAINGIPTNQLYFLRDFHGNPQHWSDWYRIANSDDVASLQQRITNTFNQVEADLNTKEKDLDNKIQQINSSSIFTSIRDLSDNNLNNATNPGIYTAYGLNLKNAPVSDTEWGLLKVFKGDVMIIQQFVDNSGQEYTRKLSGTPALWTDWTK